MMFSSYRFPLLQHVSPLKQHLALGPAPLQQSHVHSVGTKQHVSVFWHRTLLPGHTIRFGDLSVGK